LPEAKKDYSKSLSSSVTEPLPVDFKAGRSHLRRYKRGFLGRSAIAGPLRPLRIGRFLPSWPKKVNPEVSLESVATRTKGNETEKQTLDGLKKGPYRSFRECFKA